MTRTSASIKEKRYVSTATLPPTGRACESEFGQIAWPVTTISRSGPASENSRCWTVRWKWGIGLELRGDASASRYHQERLGSQMKFSNRGLVAFIAACMGGGLLGASTVVPTSEAGDEARRVLLWFGGGFMTIPPLIALALGFRPKGMCAVRRLIGTGSGRYTIFVVLTLAVASALCAVFWNELEGSNGPPLGTTIRNVMLIVGGILALPLAVWRGYVAEQQVKATRDNVNEARNSVDAARTAIANQRFQAGAQMLGHELNAVRLGAIYALADLAREDPLRFHIDAARLLAAFIQNPRTGDEVITRRIEVKSGWEEREDVVAAIATIGARTDAALHVENQQQFRVNLEGYDFSHMNLEGMNLSRLMLRKANFYDVNLKGVNFSDADLSQCTFSSADLTGANLDDAILSATNFSARRIARDGTYRRELVDQEAQPVFGLIQRQLDAAHEDADNPPKLRQVRDAETKELFFWHGKPADNL